MKAFKDSEGREWIVAVNVGTVKQVRALTGVDLLTVTDGKLFGQLADDPVTLCNVLFALCRDQCEKRSVTDEQFGCAMAGDAIEAATTALLEELVDFFPKGRRQVLQKALARAKAMQEKAIGRMLEALDDPGLEEKILKTLGNSSGNSPASSALTPTP